MDQQRDKVRHSAADCLAGVVEDGMTIAVGGFGLCGIPTDLITALRDSGATGLTIVSNNMGIDEVGLGILLGTRQVSRVVASYVGENRLFAQQYLDGQVEVEFTPQGTLAERLRAGGSGIPAFFTPTGVGTPVAEGKIVEEIDGRPCVLEHAIRADIGLVRAEVGDREGNLVYRATARNFNPLVAMAGRVTIAEVGRVSPEYLDPDLIVTPGVFVDHVVATTSTDKPIEHRTVRPSGRAETQEGARHVGA